MSMVDKDKLRALVMKWENTGGHGRFVDGLREAAADLQDVIDAVTDVADGYEQVRQQLLTSGVTDPVAVELATMQQLMTSLEPLDENARRRVLQWLIDRFGLRWQMNMGKFE